MAIRTIPIVLVLLVLLHVPAQAGVVRITFPDGKPAANARMTITVDGKYDYPLVADEDGEFVFPTDDFKTAVIAVSSNDGTGFMPVTLPSDIVNAGSLSVVIQALR